MQVAEASPLNVLRGQDSTTATLQSGELIQCGDTSGPVLSHSVWYRIPGTGGPIVFSTEGSNFDTILAIYVDADPTNPANNIGCNDDISPGSVIASKLDFNTTKGAQLPRADRRL